MRRVTVEEAHALWNIAGIKTGIKITSVKFAGLDGIETLSWFDEEWLIHRGHDLDSWKQSERYYEMWFFLMEEGDEIPEALR